MVKQYIGARYVPIFDGEYNSEKAYEPLTVVTYLNNTYTSKKTVPAGVLPSNTEYWALTGNYNAQVEEYRQEVVHLSEDVNDLADAVDEFDQEFTPIKNKVNNISLVNVKDFGAVGDGVTDDTAAFLDAINSSSNSSIYVPKGSYLLSNTINLYDHSLYGESIRETVLHFTSGNLYFGGFSNTLENITLINDTSLYALECYYCSKATNIRNIFISNSENGMKITRSWYFTVDNIRIELKSTSEGNGLLLDCDSNGGVNAGNFNGLFMSRGKHAVVFSGNGIHETNIFKSCTAEHVTDSIIVFEATRGTTNQFDGLYCEDCSVPDHTHPWVLDSTKEDAVSFQNLMLRGNNDADDVFVNGGVAINCISNTVYANVCSDGKTKCLNMYNFDTSKAKVYSTLHLFTKEVEVTVANNGSTTIPNQNGTVLQAYNRSSGYAVRDFIRYGSGDTSGYVYQYNQLVTNTTITLTVLLASN
jgi:hypothetical protein